MVPVSAVLFVEKRPVLVAGEREGFVMCSSGTVFNHIGLCATDRWRSRRVLGNAEALGGSVVERTVSRRSAMIGDPDGQLLELLQTER
ncbi:hypothetical protein MSHO_48220 [Mycobacterium shottsii]|uniref:Glyoxalase n=1 Tax=Mycobacterium shottsii TaxID=133549 RepID=A0A7I7LIQ8_9MYCO|nr:hypothetical protein [Mycobacterium shottsii]BBX59477.1 hypothetical protein MSHO_48220 [Mycobacterium shottsii]